MKAQENKGTMLLSRHHLLGPRRLLRGDGGAKPGPVKVRFIYAERRRRKDYGHVGALEKFS